MIDDDAAFRRVAALVGAGVVVVAILGYARDAATVGARVSDRANVAVVARLVVGGLDAALVRRAAVGRAGVVVVAAGDARRQADASLAAVADCAGVAVATWGRIRGVDAADVGHTAIVGAGVAVAARDSRPLGTLSLFADSAKTHRSGGFAVVVGEAFRPGVDR